MNSYRNIYPLTATLKGHMIHRGQGLDSIGNKRQELEDARKIVTDMTPTKHVCVEYETKIYCFAAIGDNNEIMIYSDLTEQFPVQLHEGMVYIFVAYVYTFNAIFLRSIKPREDASMMETFTSIYTGLDTIGHKSKLETTCGIPPLHRQRS